MGRRFKREGKGKKKSGGALSQEDLDFLAKNTSMSKENIQDFYKARTLMIYIVNSGSATGVKVFADGQILDNQWGVIAFCVYFAINCNTTAAETRSTFLHTSKYRTIVQCI